MNQFKILTTLTCSLEFILVQCLVPECTTIEITFQNTVVPPKDVTHYKSLIYSVFENIL